MSKSSKRKERYEDDQYVETDLHTKASKQLEEQVEKELEVEDPPIDEARARLKKD